MVTFKIVAALIGFAAIAWEFWNTHKKMKADPNYLKNWKKNAIPPHKKKFTIGLFIIPINLVAVYTVVAVFELPTKTDTRVHVLVLTFSTIVLLIAAVLVVWGGVDWIRYLAKKS